MTINESKNRYPTVEELDILVLSSLSSVTGKRRQIKLSDHSKKDLALDSIAIVALVTIIDERLELDITDVVRSVQNAQDAAEIAKCFSQYPYRS